MHAIYGIICKKRKKEAHTHQTGTGKKTGAGQIRHSASDCSLLLCRSLSESKREQARWDVFSMLHAGNFRLSSYIPGIVLLVLILGRHVL